MHFIRLGIWFGYGFGKGAAFSGFPMGWLRFKKETETQPRDRLLVDFSRVFCVFNMFSYDFDMVLIRFWCDVEAILMWYNSHMCSSCFRKLNKTIQNSKRNRNHTFDPSKSQSQFNKIIYNWQNIKIISAKHLKHIKFSNHWTICWTTSILKACHVIKKGGATPVQVGLQQQLSTHYSTSPQTLINCRGPSLKVSLLSFPKQWDGQFLAVPSAFFAR